MTKGKLIEARDLGSELAEGRATESLSRRNSGRRASRSTLPRY